MKRWFQALGLSLLTLSFGATSSRPALPQAQNPNERAADALAEEEVKAFLEHYVHTLENGDEQAVRALFVPDGRFLWFTDGAKSYSSPEEVLAGMARYAGIRFETTLSEVHVLPLGPRLASASSAFATKLTIPDAEEHTYGGVITWLLEKHPEQTEWRVLLGHTSTPGGPPADAAAEDR